jgi:hypothetical protein
MLYSKQIYTYETSPDFSDVHSFAGLVDSFRRYEISTNPQLLHDILDAISDDAVSMYSFFFATVRSMRVECWHDELLLDELVDRVRTWQTAQRAFYRE